MKRIMILYSAYTGSGHKSIADALTEQLTSYKDAEVYVVDGFSLIGKAGIEISKIYGPMTRGAKNLWDITYEISNQSSKALDNMLSSMVHKRFMRTLSHIRPDLIVTVHSLFNGSVIDLLEYYQIKIPFVTLQADIVNIHNTWCDPRATLTLCPTEEALLSSLRNGMPRDKLMVCGFPTRKQFIDAAQKEIRPDYDGSRPLNILMMSGGEGSGNLLNYAEAALARTDCRLKIVCGRNRRLKKHLEDRLARYGERAAVYGYVNNLQILMQASDLFITRGSPNSLMEAVVMNIPILVTGSLPGQEADNPILIEKHNLGVLLKGPSTLPAVLRAFKMDGGKRLREIRAAQLAYRNFDNTKNIAATLYGLAEHKERFIPTPERYYPIPNYKRKNVKKIKSKRYRTNI